MKSRLNTAAVLTALVLTSPLLSFAGDQSARVRPAGSSEIGNDVTRAVQQGKGAGMTRNQGVRANAYRSQTAADSASVRSGAARTNPSDPAFRK